MSEKDLDWFINSGKWKNYQEGEYVVIIDREVIAHARENLKDTLNKVRKEHPDKTPLVAKIPSRETMILNQ